MEKNTRDLLKTLRQLLDESYILDYVDKDIDNIDKDFAEMDREISKMLNRPITPRNVNRGKSTSYDSGRSPLLRRSYGPDIDDSLSKYFTRKRRKTPSMIMIMSKLWLFLAIVLSFVIILTSINLNLKHSDNTKITTTNRPLQGEETIKSEEMKKL